MNGNDRGSPLGAPELTPSFAILLTISASLLYVLVLAFLAGLFDVGGVASFVGISGIAAITSFGLCFVLARPFIEDPPETTLGFRLTSPRFFMAAVLFVPSLLLASELENVLNEIVPRPEAPDAATGPVAGTVAVIEIVLVLAFVVPVLEEIFFRGLLQPKMARSFGSAGAVIVVALLATAASVMRMFEPRQAIVALGPCLLLGLLRRSSGSILPGLCLGVLFGGLNVLAVYQMLGIPGFDNLSFAHTPIDWLVGPAAMTGVGLALCRWPGAPRPFAGRTPPDSDGDSPD